MKNKAEGTFMGVCAHVANKMDMDVFCVRLSVIVLCMLTAFVPVFVIYMILGFFAIDENGE